MITSYMGRIVGTKLSYIATDSDGAVCAHSHEPHLEGGEWVSEGVKEYLFILEPKEKSFPLLVPDPVKAEPLSWMLVFEYVIESRRLDLLEQLPNSCKRESKLKYFKQHYYRKRIPNNVFEKIKKVFVRGI